MVSGPPSEVFKKLINDTPIIHDEDVSSPFFTSCSTVSLEVADSRHYTPEVDLLNLHLDKRGPGG